MPSTLSTYGISGVSGPDGVCGGDINSSDELGVQRPDGIREDDGVQDDEDRGVPYKGDTAGVPGTNWYCSTLGKTGANAKILSGNCVVCAEG
jgi:hypothetical protein